MLWSSRRLRFYPGVQKIMWSRRWQPTPGFLSRKFHGQRSLVGYSPPGHRESDMTEQLSQQQQLISIHKNHLYSCTPAKIPTKIFKILPFKQHQKIIKYLGIHLMKEFYFVQHIKARKTVCPQLTIRKSQINDSHNFLEACREPRSQSSKAAWIPVRHKLPLEEGEVGLAHLWPAWEEGVWPSCKKQVRKKSANSLLPRHC